MRPVGLEGIDDRRQLARTLSALERGEVEAAALSRSLAGRLGRAHVVGITGAPGAGKSTLVHALLGAWLARGQRIAVLAVDPSSPITGGAVLGDRVRMGEHGANERVFIRSVAARGHLGGLARSTRAMVDVLDAAGFDTIVVETVGAGQSEVEVVQVADTRIVACPPGLGDAVQSIKAGILEIADILVVSKCDLPGAQGTAHDLRDMLHLRPGGGVGAWVVPVLPVRYDDAAAIGLLADQIEAHATAAGSGRRLAMGVTQGQAQGSAPTGATTGPAGDHPPDPHATRVAAFIAADAYVRALGIRLVHAAAGTVTLAITLEPRHVNFNHTCHGGVTFSLADTAFGMAANAFGTIAAGIDTHMTFAHAARVGDVLLARSQEISRSRKLATYRVDITREADGLLMCSFTGTVFITEQPHTLSPPQDTM